MKTQVGFPELLPALLIFTRQFATLVQHGVTIRQCFVLLAEDAPTPYAEITEQLGEHVEAGRTLYEAMSVSDYLFPPLYLAMIRAGEVGGVLDEFLGYLAELLAEEWEFRRQGALGEDDLMLFNPAAGPKEWHELSDERRLMTLSLWCRTMSMLLSARVPLDIALLTGAKILPPTQQQSLQQDAKHPELTHVLHSASFLPATALTLIGLEHQAGTLELALDHLAALYRDMFRYTRVKPAKRPAVQPAGQKRTFQADYLQYMNTVGKTQKDILQRRGASMEMGRSTDNRQQVEMDIPIGKILLDAGKITRDQLKQALILQKSTTEKLGRLLIDLGFVSERDVLEANARQLNLSDYLVENMVCDSGVAGLIPEHLQQRYHVVPLRVEGQKLVVAMADPDNVDALDNLRLVTGREVEPVRATDTEIDKIRTLQRGLLTPDWSELEREVTDTAGGAPIIRMVNVLFQNAIKQGATEIHLLLDQRQVCVRYRIDGVFYEVMTLPKFAHLPLVERLKMMAEIPLDAAPPQRGHIYLRHERQDYDAIVEVAAGEFGEVVTIGIAKQEANQEKA
ncbi:MAG: GspE/PulE family protein [Armatimonadota bacterium]